MGVKNKTLVVKHIFFEKKIITCSLEILKFNFIVVWFMDNMFDEITNL